jgi:hypothetical protein
MIEEWSGNIHHELQQYCCFCLINDNIYLKEICPLYDFIMRKFFPGPLQVKRTIPMTHGDLPRSRMFPALRQHLWGSVKSYKQFVGIVFVLIMKNCFISCLDKAVLTSLLYRAVSGPIPINSSKALSGPRPHGFLFLTAKAREGTRRKEGSRKELLSFENRWVSPGGVRKGKGES